MKIFNNNNIQKALGVYKNQNVKENNIKSTESSRLGRKDEFKISSEAKEFQAIMSKLKSTPDVREEKIEEIKTRINLGSYNIDTEKIAQKMISRFDINK